MTLAQTFTTALTEYKSNPNGESKLRVILLSDDLLASGNTSHLPLTTATPKPKTYRRESGKWVAK